MSTRRAPPILDESGVMAAVGRRGRLFRDEMTKVIREGRFLRPGPQQVGNSHPREFRAGAPDEVLAGPVHQCNHAVRTALGNSQLHRLPEPLGPRFHLLLAVTSAPRY